MTCKETIKHILKDEDFIKQLANLLNKKINSKRVYDLVNNINYPLEDFIKINYIKSHNNNCYKDFLFNNFNRYEIVEKSLDKRCIIKATNYDLNNEKPETNYLFICEYIGDEDF